MRFYNIKDIPPDRRIIFDSNIFIYSALDHPAFGRICHTLISRVEAKEIEGLVPTVILSETFHRLMIAEIIKSNRAKNTKEAIDILKEEPKMIEDLKICFEEIEKIVDMEFVILKEKESTILDSIQISKKYCLLAKDALTVSFARNYDIENIATNDSDFGRVDFLKVWKP